MSPPVVYRGLPTPSRDLPSARCWTPAVPVRLPLSAVSPLRRRERLLRQCSVPEQSRWQKQSVFAALPLRDPLPRMLHGCLILCLPHCCPQRWTAMERRASAWHRRCCSAPACRTPAHLPQQACGSRRLRRPQWSDRPCAAAAPGHYVPPARADRAHANHGS